MEKLNLDNYTLQDLHKLKKEIEIREEYLRHTPKPKPLPLAEIDLSALVSVASDYINKLDDHGDGLDYDYGNTIVNEVVKAIFGVDALQWVDDKWDIVNDFAQGIAYAKK